MHRLRRPARGITLLELLTTLAILSVAAGLSAAAVHTFAGMTSLRAASQRDRHGLLAGARPRDPPERLLRREVGRRGTAT